MKKKKSIASVIQIYLKCLDVLIDLGVLVFLVYLRKNPFLFLLVVMESFETHLFDGWKDDFMLITVVKH